MKKLAIGMLAHVDAGKTTLSEGLLYISGSIRKLGRVDYGDAFLDTDEMERARGITIFSKQAEFATEHMEVTLLDTPGHVDFSAEMERTLQVLDYAVLVISGADGVQGHTLTLWKLLKRYGIPVFLFINKMDQPGTDREQRMEELQNRLDERCVDFTASEGEGADRETFLENVSMCDEALLERYLESGRIETEEIRELVAERRVFPCFFGSALKMSGVEEFLRGLERYTKSRSYPAEFAAKVFKISRDDQGNRLTYLKVTGGSLKVKELLTGFSKESGGEAESWQEKVNQIRIYSGAKFETVNEAKAGTICAVTGLGRTYAGQGLGAEEEADMPVLEPVLSYEIRLPEDCEVHPMLVKLRQLEEEEPLLHIVWREELNQIHAQLMGEVQIDILKNQIRERFGVDVEFGAGNIVYKETIAEPVEGVGHFEPLRHYAEVHLLLEPGERGSGLQFASCCSEDVLDRNWQRLILTHLEEKEHKGVLTGSAITDMRITLTAGRAHQKHTEGGDFRQSTYRAVRQGLKKAESVLLEPYYEFRLELPQEMVGRAMTDIQKMSGSFETPEIDGETAVLTGSAPVVEMRGYQTQVVAYTKGLGRLFCTMKGYEACHNAEAVIEAMGYDSERDLDNPTGSVFCSHGAGFVVPWNQVEDYMHVESGISLEETKADEIPEKSGSLQSVHTVTASAYHGCSGSLEDDKELEAIFRRTFGESKRSRQLSEQRQAVRQPVIRERTWEPKEPVDEYLLVDGYNIIFSWEELKELAKVNLDGARHRLMDILCNYQGFKKCKLILVFDAYRVQGHACEIIHYHNIYVVYTKEAETADQYIEKTVHELGRKYRVTVATSDGLEQVIILGQGGLRMSAPELKEEIERTNQTIREEFLEKLPKKRNLLFQNLEGEAAAYVEEVQNGDKKTGAP
ncbi:MAG: TetM/TetW/TetO/TetS family tetracycline resistance ribosomal protection protein [Lachnospiraceae bacterium]|nr:TetM/TetW/TetO/TetS family tetracycline resistance ribosomal protection protein [Lachnospiraceae bacterium]